MAVCPWCKLAVGSQVVRMTVIDVQVFGSSNTETPEPQHTCVRSFTLVMRTHTHKSIQPTLGVKKKRARGVDPENRCKRQNGEMIRESLAAESRAANGNQKLKTS